MAAGRQEGDEWVRRVLGLELPGSSELTGRIAALEPRLQRALRAAPEEGTALAAAWAMLGEQADKGDDAAALKILGALERRIDAALAAPARSDAEKFGIREGIVAERRAELEAHLKSSIAAASADAGAEIAKLTRALDEFFEEAQQVVDAVRGHVRKALRSLEGGLMARLESGSEEDLAELTAEWLDRLNADPVIIALRDAWTELGVSLEFDSTMDVLLQDVARTVRMSAA